MSAKSIVLVAIGVVSMYCATIWAHIFGDRPHGSFIFQCFSDAAPATTPRLGLLAGPPLGGSPPNEFTFNSLFFRRDVV